MTNEEAIKIIEDKTSINEPLELYEALKLAIEALEKQVAKKLDKGNVFYACPACGHERPIYGKEYCEHCGQKLDWN